MMGGGGMMGGGSAATSPPTTSAPAPSGGGSGRALFLSSACGSCHTLAAAGTSSQAGPNLDQAQPSAEQVVERVTNGGGGMPAFGGSLTAAQIRAIADYVAAATH